MSEVNLPAKNIWDSFHVEVNAEFKKIKLSLGELRQITEGLVIDVASVVDNEILLHVDGKRIAFGELVIIDDKYGVKITKVFHDTKHEQEIATRHAAIKQDNITPKPDNDEKYMENSNENKIGSSEDDVIDNDDDDDDDNDDSDFDYNDFEIEDEI